MSRCGSVEEDSSEPIVEREAEQGRAAEGIGLADEGDRGEDRRADPGGAWGYAAAEAAGISARTYYDWLARGEGRSARGSSPKLTAFANRVRQAEAEARVLAEAEVYRARPALWLSRRARSQAGREGWSTPVTDGDGPSFSLDYRHYQDPEVRAELYRVHELMLQIEPEFVIPSCPDLHCPCAWHRSRSAGSRDVRRGR